MLWSPSSKIIESPRKVAITADSNTNKIIEKHVFKIAKLLVRQFSVPLK